jgi:hypothetical protein
MGDKVALPSLSLPKQKTHWTVGVVIAAGVLLVILGAAFYAVLQNRQAESNAIARREADRLASIKAETEKAQAQKEQAEAEKAASEAKKKAEEATLAAQKKAPVATAAPDDDKKDNKGKKKNGSHKAGGAKVANGKAGGPAAASPSAPAAAPAPAPKPSSKASKDIDDLLRSFK